MDTRKTSHPNGAKQTVFDPELLTKIGVTPDLVGIVMGLGLACVLPQNALVKLLIERGLISQDDAIEIYQNLLTSAPFPSPIEDVTKPIWESVLNNLTAKDLTR